MANLTVEKIGGTTMTRFGEVLDGVILKNPDDILGRVYVVSAYGGVTNTLLEHKKTGQQGIFQSFARQQHYDSDLEKLKEQLCTINQRYEQLGLDLATADSFICKRIDGVCAHLQSMSDVLASGYLPRQALLLAGRELLASVGEMHSAFNSANILQNRGYDARFIDLSGWGDARELTIDERISDAFARFDPTSCLSFATGYCKGTEGIMRQFDRGYSEVTFSKVAVFLAAREAVIHKEFHLCSADPLIVGLDKAKPVCNTNFDVADQLADVGMEAIHPKASKPLERAGIPIRVRNAFDPHHSGTLITKDYVGPESRTEVVAGALPVTMLEVHDAGMVGQVGSDLEIMQIMANYNVSYISKASNANTIGTVIWEKDLKEEMIQKLRERFDLVTVTDVAIVCAIGSNIAKPGMLAHAAGALARAGVNIVGVSQTARQTNMQFVVSREHFVTAQKALHAELCE
jgi:aspartate kinase